ncbi:MAG TPA: riboflavin biosynthesis protein RibF [Trueperaceae bacterium]|nr:riboflavin biosynthesis protein RibF [Trueperaceae bacterium]
MSGEPARDTPAPQVVEALAELDLKHAVICIGNFDGVHLGHRALLGRMSEVAASVGAPSVVVTFFPPAKVVFGNATYLSSAEEKLELLAGFGPTAVVLERFSREYAQTDKAVFVDRLRRMAPHTIIVGEDFRFGHLRQGTLNDLSPIAQRLEAFGLITAGGEVVKSSRVREHLAAGRIDSANALLGAPYPVRGEVITGAQRGRTIGYPTANIATGERKALPGGVFAVTVDTPTGRFGGMANVGPRPSFPDEPPSLEVHLFDYAGDLYGRTVTTRFRAFLRTQRKFGGLDELTAQLAEDERAARAALADVIYS